MSPVNGYQILAQLATNFRQRRLTQTADLVEELQAELFERFGPIEPWRISPRAVPPWLTEYVETLRRHAAFAMRGDQYGQMDLGAALGIELAIGLLAQAVAEQLPLTPQDAQRLVGTTRHAVDRIFEQINAARDSEWRTARFLSERRWQENRRAVLGQQERDRQIAQLRAVKANLEAALAQ